MKQTINSYFIGKWSEIIRLFVKIFLFIYKNHKKRRRLSWNACKWFKKNIPFFTVNWKPKCALLNSCKSAINIFVVRYSSGIRNTVFLMIEGALLPLFWQSDSQFHQAKSLARDNARKQQKFWEFVNDDKAETWKGDRLNKLQIRFCFCWDR